MPPVLQLLQDQLLTRQPSELLPVLLVFLESISLSGFTRIGSDIDGEAAGDYSGRSVSLSSNGSVVAIGADYSNSDRGYVRVYQNNNGTWTQIGSDIDGLKLVIHLVDPLAFHLMGPLSLLVHLIMMAMEIVAVMYVSRNINNSWTQIGSDIDGEVAGDYSGNSISLSADGSIVAIGASHNDGNGSNSGHVRVYKNINNTWTQIGSDIDGEAISDESGHVNSLSLSSDGSFVAIGALSNDGNGNSSGHVRIYKNINNTWTQVGSDIDGEAALDSSGKALSLSADGSIIAIGAYQNDGNGNSSGHVRIYRNINNTWTQIGSDIDGEAAGDQSGYSVSLSADGSLSLLGLITMMIMGIIADMYVSIKMSIIRGPNL